MDALKDMTLPAALVLAAVVLGGFGSVVALVVWGHESLGAIAAFIGSVAGAYIAWRTAQQGKTAERIEANTNGTLSAERQEKAALQKQMTTMASEHARTVAQLTALLPAGAPLPKSLAEDHAA